MESKEKNSTAVKEGSTSAVSNVNNNSKSISSSVFGSPEPGSNMDSLVRQDNEMPIIRLESTDDQLR